MPSIPQTFLSFREDINFSRSHGLIWGGVVVCSFKLHSVSQYVMGLMTRCLTVWQLRSCPIRASSLTRGRVCLSLSICTNIIHIIHVDSWHSGWPFLIRFQLAGRGPMEVGAAGRSADWLADRSP
jgi:hypothetical protein